MNLRFPDVNGPVQWPDFTVAGYFQAATSAAGK